MPVSPLIAQTTYAELLERCAASAFSDAFPENGTFTPKTIKGRRYWYFQIGSAQGRSQRYVGPESPELLENYNTTRFFAVAFRTAESDIPPSNVTSLPS